jgi:hypothetical protein
MKNPPHPGYSIKDACLDPLGLSVTEAAKVLGVARPASSMAGPGYRLKWHPLARASQIRDAGCVIYRRRKNW